MNGRTRGRVDYNQELYCSHCEDKFPIEDCKLIPKYGYRCPECGRKCRKKAHYNYKMRQILHPYIPTGHKGEYIVTEIKKIAQENRMV